MRELKFRAWSEETHTLYSSEDIREFTLGCVKNGDVWRFEQYTGLHDCNDKEIYEGDILRWISSTGRELRYAVKWDTSAWCWTAGGYMLSAIIEQDCQVIGNIHEIDKCLA